MNLSGILALLAIDALAIGRAPRLWATLPDRVPSKFDLAGNAIAWLPRDAFVGGYLGLIALFTAVALLTALTVSRRDPDRLRVPNADHWLAPERRDATLAWLRGFGFWMSALVIGLFVRVAGVIERYSLGQVDAARELPRLLVLFAAAIGVLLTLFALRFSRPEIKRT